MKEKIYRSLVELTNGKTSSKVLKAITTSKVSKPFIRSYSKVYGINTAEVSNSVDSFSSLHQFFTRTLKEGARPVDEANNVYISPVDAKVESFGMITSDCTLTVKNKPYSVVDLLGSEEQAKVYKNGSYIVFYLSPADYHRIHSPIDAHVLRQYVLGQKSYPVNQLGLSYGKKPISHNYRLVTELETSKQQFAFIKVGAMFVNSIELTNTSDVWQKGQEVGYFSFGSTVVMLFEEAAIQFTDNVVQGEMVRMGERFATML